jgi:hypothetical protein
MSDAQKVAYLQIKNRLEIVDKRYDLVQRVLDNVIKESNSLEKEKEILGDAIEAYERYILE